MKTTLTRRWPSLAGIVLAATLLSGCGGPPPATSWSGLVVADSTAYVTATDRIYAIDIGRDTNNLQRQKWSFPPANQGASVTFHGQPYLTEDGVLIAGSDSFTGRNNIVVALNTGQVVDVGDPSAPATTAGTLWTYPASSNAGALSSIFDGIASDGDSVFFGTNDGTVVSLDIATGRQTWVYTATQRIWARPIVTNSVVYVTSQDHRLYALDAETGRPAWSKPFEAGALLAGTPTAHDGTVYVGGFDQNLYAIDAADGTPRWEQPFKAQGWLWDGPAVFDDILYLGDLSGNLYAVDLNGKSVWDQPLVLEGMIRARPLVTEDRIFVATGARKLYAIDRATRSIAWVFTALQDGESFLTTPALAGELLLVPPLPSGGAPVRLYAVNARSGNLEWQFPVAQP